MKGLLREFKAFALRGNVMDLAVGVLIGASFGKIVTSVVNDLLTPLLGLVAGGLDFKNLYLILTPGASLPPGTPVEKAAELGVATLNYGNFIQNIIDFTIIALCIFVMVKIMNALSFKAAKNAQQQAPSEPVNTTESLLEEIRDILKKTSDQ